MFPPPAKAGDSGLVRSSPEPGITTRMTDDRHAGKGNRPVQ